MDVTKREHAFQYLYEKYCDIQNCPVLYRVNVHVHMGVLDFYGDGLKVNDWKPLLKALSMDRYLHFVAIKSKAPPRPITAVNDSKKVSLNSTFQAIPCSVLAKIPVTLTECLSINHNLTDLGLDGLHLTMDSLQILASGLSKSSSLKCISLRRCLIGDGGCKIICTALRNHSSIIFVDFSACDLSERGAIYVSLLLQYQNLNRYNEIWKQSLRYRMPNNEAMPGLRRITLSHNNIGDQGAQHIIQVLRDDRWIKAVDLQNCNLTEESGQEILKLFQINDTISILDVRNNKLMLSNTVAAIILRLTGRRSQFEWHSDDPTCLPRTTSQTTVKLTALRKSDGIRKTVSNIFPSENIAAKELRKSVSTPHTSQRANNRLFHGTWSGTESTSHLELQKNLEQLRQQLKKEVVRRKAAEETRDKAESRLENHLRQLAATQAAIDGRVLVDKTIVEQVNSTIGDLNRFFTVIQRVSIGQSLNLPILSSNQESWNSSNTSDIKCYNDNPTSTETSGAKTKDTAADVECSPPLAGHGDGLCNGQVKSSPGKRISRDTSTLRNSCAEGESRYESFSGESDHSWTTFASRSSLKASG